MCELLIRESDRGQQGIVPGCVIDVREDGASWGRKESIERWVAEGLREEDWPGDTRLVKMPGVPADKMRYLLEAETETVTDERGEKEQRVVKRRKHRLKIENLPAEKLTTRSESEVKALEEDRTAVTRG